MHDIAIAMHQVVGGQPAARCGRRKPERTEMVAAVVGGIVLLRLPHHRHLADSILRDIANSFFI